MPPAVASRVRYSPLAEDLEAADREVLELRVIGQLSAEKVAAVLGKKTTALGPTRDGLLKKAVCYSPRWGEIDFTVPMFDTFMRRWIPDLKSVVDQP